MCFDTDIEKDSDVYSQYTSGECHIFATMLHRLYGWKLLVIYDPNDIFWEDEKDYDNSIPCIYHVYALDQFNNIWDITGCHSYSQLSNQLDELFDRTDFLELELNSEEELMYYIQDDENQIEKPLCSFVEQDILQAKEVFTNHFRGYVNIQSGVLW